MLRKNRKKQERQRKADDATAISPIREELRLEAELQREEIALGLRNEDGSIPPGTKVSIIQSRRQRPAISPKTARYGELLADWMNQSKGSPEHRRICGFIADIEAVRKSVTGPYVQTSVVVGGRSFSGGMPRQVADGEGEYEKRMSRLKKKSRSYTFYLALHFPLEGQWVGSLVPVGKRTARSEFRLGEHDVIWWLHEVAMDGELDRLRMCECGCGFWFFAKRHLDTRFYKDHRQKPYRESPKFRTHRAEYMRAYRRREKEREEQGLMEGHRRYKRRANSN